ncbi:MAG: PAS domain-containing protein [Desulfuromonadales bacterium]
MTTTRNIIASAFIEDDLRKQINELEKHNKQLQQAITWQTSGVPTKEHTESASEDETKFRVFVENINDVLFALTASDVFSYVSPQWRDAFGYACSETIGQSFLLFIHPDDAPSCMEFLHKVVETGEKMSGMEYRVRCKDGRYLWFRANAALMKDPVDGTSTLVGIGRDITELKNTENDLIKLLQNYYFSVETSQCLAWRCDSEGRYTWLNPAMGELLGYEEDEIIGKKFSDFLDSEHLESTLADFFKVMKNNADIHHKTTFKGKSGNEIHLIVKGVLTYDNHGELIGANGTAYDITLRIQVEEALKKSDNRWKMFLMDSEVTE